MKKHIVQPGETLLQLQRNMGFS